MFFIYNLGPASQAGRRGFESRLPLHLFNCLPRIKLLAEPTFRGNEAIGELQVTDNEGH